MKSPALRMATAPAVSPVRSPDPDADLWASALLPAQLPSNRTNN